jgi:hypothetical protein
LTGDGDIRRLLCHRPRKIRRYFRLNRSDSFNIAMSRSVLFGSSIIGRSFKRTGVFVTPVTPLFRLSHERITRQLPHTINCSPGTHRAGSPGGAAQHGRQRKPATVLGRSSGCPRIVTLPKNVGRLPPPGDPLVA